MRIPPAYRRALALTALLAFSAGSGLEPVLGTLRDGAVHHESGAQAEQHRADAFGDHGHEDGGARSTEHEHGSQHEHGTATDHCTHAHGLGLPAAIDLTIGIAESDVAAAPVLLPADRVPEAHSPPPRL